MVQMRIFHYFRSALFIACLLAQGVALGKPLCVIIGAGLAGLTTGYRLDAMGFEVRIDEAKNRVGGRVASVFISEKNDPQDSYASDSSCNDSKRIGEMGAHNILDAESAKNIQQLIEELDLETVKSVQPVQLYYLKEGVVSDPNGALKKMGFTPASLKARINLICKDATTMHAVLQELFKDNELLYESFRIRLEDFEGDSVKNLSTSCADSLYRFLLEELYSDPNDDEGEICYEDYLCIKGGNSLLPLRLAGKLEGKVFLNKVLEKVGKNGKRYVLTFADNSVVEADILILTIPCPVYNDIEFEEGIIPADRLDTIRSIRYGTNSKILVPVEPTQDKDLYSFTNGRVIALRGGHDNIATMYYIDGHGNFTQDTIKDVYERDLATLLMNSTISSLLDEPVIFNDELFSMYRGPVGYSWPNDPYAKGSYSYPGAGQEQAFTSLTMVAGEHVKELFAPIDNTLFFAGEATSILLKSGGTMEAAVASGEDTARLIGKLHAPAEETESVDTGEEAILPEK